MSNHLNSLLDRVEKTDTALARELRAQIEGLAKRREFGLNFEKHKPETVELHGRRVRVGDKVRYLAPRGSAEAVRRETWIVQSIKAVEAKATALLALAEGDEMAERLVEDLVVVADFQDPIYPGLKSTGKVERGGDKPSSAVINAENFHALEAMLFTYQGKVDVIYIDPPYNGGARDWKYNNDYVDSEDSFRHSKWLSFMERRLKMAKKLLNPQESVLIVTIDEKEYLRLGLLLEQVFVGARIQMVSVGINPAAVARNGYFGRSDEYYFFVMLGKAGVRPARLGAEWITTKGRTHLGQIRWDLLRKSGSSPHREGHAGTFYPIFVSNDGARIVRIGDSIDPDVPRQSVEPMKGEVVLWPIRDDGTEGRWAVGPSVARTIWADGFLKLGRFKGEATPIYYLAKGERRKIADGVYVVEGRAFDGSVITSNLDSSDRVLVPGTQWRLAGHDSTQYGSRLLRLFLPDRKFPFPKSLYAVEDALRFFVGDRLDALVVDFFAGSGTTAHAVARLNRQDGGQRRSIIVTNNEVSSDEATALTVKGYRPGDPEWEALGICSYITKPRIEAAITGLTSDGERVKGDYKFTDDFPMSDGFEENVEFFDLTYEDPRLVSLDMAFDAIAPLLWMRAGSVGRRIDKQTETFGLADTYGVLFNVDAAGPFLKAVGKADGVRIVFIVTDDEKQFQMIASDLPRHVEAVRLYESYLRTFEINTGKE